MKSIRASLCLLLISLLFISFTAQADRWEDMKNKLEKSVKKSIKNSSSDDDSGPGDFAGNGYANGHWISFMGAIPGDAVPGGFVHGQPAIICQGDYQGEPHPGRLTDGGGCAVAFGGQEYISPVETVLVGHHYYWQNFYPDQGVPPNAVLGGTEGGAPIFICQARLDDGIYPGKLVGDNNCYVAAHHVEVARQECKVLCRGDTPPQSYNAPAMPGSYAADDSDDDD